VKKKQSAFNRFQDTFNTWPGLLREGILLFVSALFMTLSFAPFNFWPLSFLSLFPLFPLLLGKPAGWRISLLRGSVLALFLNSMAYQWLIYTMKVFGHIPLSVSILLFLLYSFFFGLRFFLFFWIASIWKRSADKGNLKGFSASPYFYLPLSFAIAEFAGFQLFPWFGGNLFAGNLLIMQAADLVGVRGLSIFWIIISLGFFQLANRNLTRSASIAASLFLVLHLYGAATYWIHSRPSDKFLTAGVVQGNTPLSFASYRNVREELNRIVSKMAYMSKLLVQTAQSQGKKVDVIIWPESAVPFLRYQTSLQLQAEIASFQRETQTELIFNDIYTDMRSGNSYSNVSLFNKNGFPVSDYQKIFLLPFGEYIPLSDLYPAVKEIVPEISDFKPGKKFELLNSAKAPLLPAICYEIIQPDFIRSFYNKTNGRAKAIVNITNDTWFGRTQESYQHLQLASARAIELRLPILRAVNSGVSAWVDSTGRIHGKTELFTAENKLYEVPLSGRGKTVFALLGNIPLWLFIAFGTLTFLRSFRKISAKKS